jgi:hypothetical protein
MFWTIWNFPNCISALDSKHVVIEAPANSGSQDFNCRKSSSFVLSALVDAHCKYVAVCIGSYGRNSDGGIFSNGKGVERNELNVPDDKPLAGTTESLPHVVVGDETFQFKAISLKAMPQIANTRK